MSDRVQHRADRLTRLYPRRWRRLYPDFSAVLAEELAVHPWRASADVWRTASVERLRDAGVLPTTPEQRSRFGLALVFAALVPFAGLSAGMWSQLHTEVAGRDVLPPALHPTDVLLAAGTALACVALGVAAFVVAARHRSVRRGTGGRLLGPALTLGAAVGGLSLCGWTADRSGWYSPAAAALPAGGPGHTLTLWARGVVAAITPAWGHPSVLGRLPTLDLAATVAAPALTLLAGAALLSLFGRLARHASRRALVMAALVADGAMFLATAATARWLVENPVGHGVGLGDTSPGHTPVAVLVLLGLLALTAALGTWRTLRRPEPLSGSHPGSDPGGVLDAGRAAPPSAHLVAQTP